MKMKVRDVALTALLLGASLSASAADLGRLTTPPTRKDGMLLRGGPGAFDAPRDAGAKHAGVDIVATLSVKEKARYAVFASGAGVVAYARVNGDAEQGFGYTVILDHDNGLYSQYSHLATLASGGVVKVGDIVHAGQLIGYLADLSSGELSSGNVRADVVKPYDKIQLHFELFEAPRGRRSERTISVLKNTCNRVDPTATLAGFGYKSY